MALTAKQQAFISEYLIDYNATRAAERAGYSGNANTLAVTGHDLLRNPNVAEAISKRLAETAMSADEVLMRLAEQARAAQNAYLRPGGVDMESLIRDGKAHLVKAIKHTQFGDNIEFHDAQAALVHIGKHHGLFKDIVETKSEIELEVDEETRTLFSRIAGLASRLRADDDASGVSADPTGESVT